MAAASIVAATAVPATYRRQDRNCQVTIDLVSSLCSNPPATLIKEHIL